MIRDQTYAQNPITIAMFAHRISRSVQAFLQVNLLRHVPRDCTESYRGLTESDAKTDSKGGI